MVRRMLLTLAALVLAPIVTRTQGPLLSYLTDPLTDLPWAACRVTLQGGSSRKIPFLPVVTSEYAPLGTARYTRDIRVDAPLLFAGSGIVKAGGVNAYGDLDASGKAVLFSYDFPDAVHEALEKEFPLATRIREAARRGAAAIVAFSAKDENPFPRFNDRDPTPPPDVPVIVVNRRSAEVILAAAGVDAGPVFEKWKTEGTVAPRALIARLNLRIDGAFERLERPGFTFVFERNIGSARVGELAAMNEKSLTAALDLFKPANVTWHKSFVTYFRDFDSKLFYTHHWGRGLSADAGSFMVFDPATVNLGLAVHENTHTLLTDNWGGTSSFMNEGFARYAEAMATSRDKDHAETAGFLGKGTLLPLARMLTMNIGRDEGTDIAYPAAGSFVTYLVQQYGLPAAKRAWTLEARDRAAKDREDTWTTAIGKPLATLEQDWHAWLPVRTSKR